MDDIQASMHRKKGVLYQDAYIGNENQSDQSDDYDDWDQKFQYELLY